MDVLLEVKLRFGSRRMVLRDVLALSSGMVVELDGDDGVRPLPVAVAPGENTLPAPLIETEFGQRL